MGVLQIVLVLAAVAAAGSEWVPTQGANMNGPYQLSRTPNGSKERLPWAEAFSNYPNGCDGLPVRPPRRRAASTPPRRRHAAAVI